MQQQFYNDLGLYQLCLVLQKLVEFKDFSRLLSDFLVFFKADLIFQDFSRKQTQQIREQRTKFVTGRKRVNKYEPRHEISNNVVCVTSKASDQPVHTRSLIRTFASRLNIL